MKRNEMMNMMVLVGVIILGAVYLVNIEKNMIILESMLNTAGSFIAEHREMLDRIANMALVAVPIILVVTLLKDLVVFLYEGLQDEDSIVFIVLFAVTCIVTYIPFQVYKVCRRVMRKAKKSKQRKSRG